jgi:hypothetical protein
VSLGQLSPGQVAEIVSLGSIRGEYAAAEEALCGLASLTCRVRDSVILDFRVRRERASGDTSQGWTVGVTREW